jgi:hypothetical protein
MSYASLQIVQEFFTLNSFLTLRLEDVLVVKNIGPAREPEPSGRFVLDKEDLAKLANGLVKPVAWHTLKFVPSVLKKDPEILYIIKNYIKARVKQFFGAEPFRNLLVIPDLPAGDNLRQESIAYMKEKGIDGVVRFSTVISGLIQKINPRQVYLSETREILRILKFYRFFPESQPVLPFKEK